MQIKINFQNLLLHRMEISSVSCSERVTYLDKNLAMMSDMYQYFLCFNYRGTTLTMFIAL